MYRMEQRKKTNKELNMISILMYEKNKKEQTKLDFFSIDEKKAKSGMIYVF